MEPTRNDLNLPADLVSFLVSGKQLEYDPAACEAGAITLLPLTDLKLQRFPVETGSLKEFKQDPHYPNHNSYLVSGVDLVAGCSGGYDHESLLMWLPVEARFGIWDSSHCGIRVFGPDVTWEQIVADPVSHINAGWTGIDPKAPPMEDLIPWPNHPYGDCQVYDPQPA
jgi:hypothetical protein